MHQPCDQPVMSQDDACTTGWCMHHRLMHAPQAAACMYCMHVLHALPQDVTGLRMHHRLMHVSTACFAPWRHRLMHPDTAWGLKFQVCLGYTLLKLLWLVTVTCCCRWCFHCRKLHQWKHGFSFKKTFQ